jgi:hypothetical protein
MMPARSKVQQVIASWGTGATVVGLAFGIRPMHATRLIFWMVVASGVAMFAVGAFPFFGTRLRQPRGRRVRDESMKLAAECRRVHDALRDLIADCDRGRPRVAIFGGERIEQWRHDTAARYRVELRAWARQVFNGGLVLGVVSATARQLVEEPSAAQLHVLADLFLQAAEQLEAA